MFSELLSFLCLTPQTIQLTMNFYKPLLCVMLICGNFHCIMPVLPDKAVFVSAVLLCVQRYQGNLYFTPPKPSGKD